VDGSRLGEITGILAAQAVWLDEGEESMEEKKQSTNGETNGSANSHNSNGKKKISRREFLKVATATVVGVAGASALGSCDVAPTRPGIRPVNQTIDRVPIAIQYPAVPWTPPRIPEAAALRFFTPHEALTVEAFTARLLPGTPEDPGAREAGVVYYVDGLLSRPEGFAEGIYRKPPYAATFSGNAPPDTTSQPGAEGIIWVPEDEIERYGYQSILNPREVMRMGLAALDRFANQQFDDDFANLPEESQDAIIEAMVEDEAEGFEPLTAKSFFMVMRRHTMEGMFSDPVYGGNRNMAGWRLLGFPGSQRAYTPAEVMTEGSGLAREPWSIAHMPHFNPGERVNPNTINPVTGTDEHLVNPSYLPEEYEPQHQDQRRPQQYFQQQDPHQP
jgi:gluconate 2-dehydrogenase gamma chain